MKVLNIEPESPLYGHVRPGYKLVSVNDQTVMDAIDFAFKIATERAKLSFHDPKGRVHNFDFDEWSAEELGLTFDENKIRMCKNDCVFCFVAQQPQGMRRVLYFRDEDYRLSFTHGNFVTLSNTTEKDLTRIIEQRLSPLYISVHASDDRLRRCMLRNEKLAPIIPSIRKLTENGITVHSQAVLCPGINDGEQMMKTINDLASLYPGVESLAVVPVGLTKYRKKLASLRTYSSNEARDIIKSIEKLQQKFLKNKGSRFVWIADEFYVQAQMKFPLRKEYEHMPQFENGIGMCREFITMFNRRRSRLTSFNSSKKVLFLTGHSAYPMLKNELFPYIKEKLRLNADLHKVSNRFWGESVTVSGLLTGQDLLRHARSYQDKYDLFVLPPNCLNQDNLFLDNLTLEQFESVLGKAVLVGGYDFASTIREAYS